MSRCAPLTSGCASARQLMIFFLHHVSIEPRQTRLLEEKEEISHAAKLSPQEQCATAFGLVTLNPPFCRSSLKSSSEPLTKSALLGSTTTRTLCGLDEDVAIGRSIDQIHFVLQAGTTATDHRDAQRALRPALFFEERNQFARRVFGHLDQALIADLVIDPRVWS